MIVTEIQDVDRTSYLGSWTFISKAAGVVTSSLGFQLIPIELLKYYYTPLKMAHYESEEVKAILKGLISKTILMFSRFPFSISYKTPKYEKW